MSAVEVLPLDALNDPAAETPEWETLRRQHGDTKANLLPRGTYDATLIEVKPIRRRDTGTWLLRMLARTDRLGRFVVAWRGLSENPDDPFDLTDGQVKGLRKFADSMGIPTPAPAQEIVEALGRMLGQSVTAKVVHTPVGQQATLSREPATITVPARPVTVDLEGRARQAQVAHEKIVEGQQAANYALACAAEGCYELQKSEGWIALGYESLSEYLASPEITMSRSEFYRLAKIYERYMLEGKVAPIALQAAGPTKLEVPLPALEQGVVDAEQAVADAASMNRTDLRKHYAALLANGEDAPDPDEPDGVCTAEELADDPAGGTAAATFEGMTAEEWARVYERELARANRADSQTQRLRRSYDRLVATLQRVLDEVGRPEQKRMSKALRAEVMEVLAAASEHGLDGGL